MIIHKLGCDVRNDRPSYHQKSEMLYQMFIPVITKD